MIVSAFFVIFPLLPNHSNDEQKDAFHRTTGNGSPRCGLMEYMIRHVTFIKRVKDGEDIIRHARIITYADIRKTSSRLIQLLTNNIDTDTVEIVAIYEIKWEIKLLFKQLKQNFPLGYFYGESTNAIKTQIWMMLIANLLMMVMQKKLKRQWSCSGLATMVRITLMYYVNCYTFLEEPEKDWLKQMREQKSLH